MNNTLLSEPILKVYELHWKDGSIEEIQGQSILSALRENNFDSGHLMQLNHYTESYERK